VASGAWLSALFWVVLTGWSHSNSFATLDLTGPVFIHNASRQKNKLSVASVYQKKKQQTSFCLLLVACTLRLVG